MIKLSTYANLLVEKRRDFPPTVYDQLYKYINDDHIFVSLTKLEKVGLNPQSLYDTPLGIYCYPLKDSVLFYGKTHRNGEINFPFPKNPNNYFVLRANTGIRIMDSDLYDNTALQKDIKILIYK
jgi:hypothetical protein